MNMTGIREINMQVKQEAIFLQDLLSEINKVMVGQEALVERVLIALLADGHALLEGLPGLAKSMAVDSLARAVGGMFQDITGVGVDWRQAVLVPLLAVPMLLGLLLGGRNAAMGATLGAFGSFMIAAGAGWRRSASARAWRRARSKARRTARANPRHR